jgi:iron(III)-enterobactin esterase
MSGASSSSGGFPSNGGETASSGGLRDHVSNAGDSSGGLGNPVSNAGDGDFTISPPYSPAPELSVEADVPHGTVHDFNLSSTLSAIYPTDFKNGMPFSRNVAVYVPEQYVTGSAAPFMVVQDGVSFYRSAMVPVLDNMIGHHRLPAIIAIFIEPGPNGDTPKGERSFEYDTVSDAYATFIETEVLPKIEADYGLTLTADPEGRATMGGSSGGAAAFTMGWFRPDRYRRILTYSGSFVDLQPTPSYPQGAWQYHQSLIAGSPMKQLRVALEVGENDGNWNTPTSMDRDWRKANQAMALALASSGYHYRFVYALGATHMDSRVLQQTLPETLEWLWQGYPNP